MPVRSILAWLAIGLVVGVFGKLVVPGKDRDGWTVMILVGIAGAVTTGFVAETMHWTDSGTWQSDSASAVGAVAALVLFRLVRRHRSG
jgi:uncharacterized membrane protein YeaQ/YmgE (transglycosylase-associated protein family)